MNIVLPRFNYHKRDISHFLSKIDDFNTELVSLRNQLNFVSISSYFIPQLILSRIDDHCSGDKPWYQIIKL